MYYRFSGRAVAYANDSGLKYLLADHLQSSHAEVLPNQTEASQRRYFPFGSDRSVSGANDLAQDERYTGQRRVEAGGGSSQRELYHYGARAYLPGVGVFTQPDSIVPEPVNPQALNRYAYVYNNPLRYMDPTGHDPFGPEWVAKFQGKYGREPNDLDRLEWLKSYLQYGFAEGVDWTESWGSGWGGDENLSGTELFSRYVERLALLYTPDEKDKFVRAMGLVFSGIEYSNDVWTALERVQNNTGLTYGKWIDIPVSGLRPEFLDSNRPGDNQTHHYVAYFVLGYFRGEFVGYAAALKRDIDVGIFRGKAPNVNWGDVQLGIVGATEGAIFRRGIVTPEGIPALLIDHNQLGGYIRRSLLEAP